MIDNWQKSFELMLESEGGYGHHPSDPGGRTNLGVTQRVWEEWVGRESNEKEMRSLTPEMVKPLYKRKFWDACKCDELFTGIDYLVFDFAVNAGVGRSIKTLQSAVGTTPDGWIGPITMAAVEAIDPQPVEGIRSTGASALHEIVYGVIPQVMPLWISFALYRFESNVRSASVVGMVGAGGIGVVLWEIIRGFQYAETCAVMAIIVVSVTAIDLISARIRKILV